MTLGASWRAARAGAMRPPLSETHYGRDGAGRGGECSECGGVKVLCVCELC